MATHCNVLAWETPWTEEPGSPQPLGSQSWTELSDRTTKLTYYSFYILLSLLIFYSEFCSSETLVCVFLFL